MTDSKEKTDKKPFYFNYFKPEILEKMFENQSRMLFLWPVKFDSKKFCSCSSQSICMGKIAFENLNCESSDCFPICCDQAMREVLQTSYDELVIQIDQEDIFPFSNIVFGQYWNRILVKTITDIENLLQSSISCDTLQLYCTMFYRKYLELLYRLLFIDKIQKIKLVLGDVDITSQVLGMLNIKLPNYDYSSTITFEKDDIIVYNLSSNRFERLEFDCAKFFGFEDD